MSKFISLHNHSDASLLDGLSKVEQMVERANELGQNAIGLTNHGVLSDVPEFVSACKEGGVKPLIGCELYVPLKDSRIKDGENRSTPHLPVLAKNLAGWQALMGLVSESNRKENYYYKPRLDLDKIAKYGGNLICFTGHPGTHLANLIFKDYKAAYRSKTVEEAQSWVSDTWEEDCLALIGRYQDIFGKENFFLEIQLIDAENIPAVKILAKCLRYLAKKVGARCVGTADAHFMRRENAIDQRLILCSGLKTTFNKVNAAIANNEDVQLGAFFRSNNYFIPGFSDVEKLYEPEEIVNTLLIAEMVEQYNILCQPRIPQFLCSNANEELRQRCRDGWRKFISGTIPKNQQDKYVQRVQTELKVFEDAGLAHYFLVMGDICRYAKEELGALLGAARGSAGGCLVSMLIGITDKSVDPVKNGLTFERFYNSGRNTKDRISMPDIDIDFPAWSRPLVFKYIRQKYGEDKCAQISTSGRLQGKGALKEVLRVNEVCSFAEMNRVCVAIPGNDKISDDLQEMEEEDGEATSIRWALENQPDDLKEWCMINKEGQLEGPYARYFQQAMRLEGVRKNQGLHAAGMIISPVPLSEVCPLVYHKKSEHAIVGVDKNGCELLGLVKADILVTSVLDKLMDIEKLLLNGQLEEEQPFIEGSDSGPADGSV